MQHQLKKWIGRVGRVGLLWILSIGIAQASDFVSGKDYVTFPLAGAKTETSTVTGKVSVIEFFSYECPGCFHTDPLIEKWVRSHATQVEFERVPVVFRPDWEPYARAYYVADQLGLLQKIHTPFFKAIHESHQMLSDETSITAFFVRYGADPKAVHRLWTATTTQDALARGERLMKTYQIYRIPAVVINGQYKVDMGMTNNQPDRFIAVMNDLVMKSREK